MVERQSCKLKVCSSILHEGKFFIFHANPSYYFPFALQIMPATYQLLTSPFFNQLKPLAIWVNHNLMGAWESFESRTNNSYSSMVECQSCEPKIVVQSSLPFLFFPPKTLSKSKLLFPLCTSNNAPNIPIIDLIVLLTSSNHWLFGSVTIWLVLGLALKQTIIHPMLAKEFWI